MQAAIQERRFLRGFLALTAVLWLSFGVMNCLGGYSQGPLQVAAGLIAATLFGLQSRLPHALVAHLAIGVDIALLFSNALYAGGSFSTAVWMFTIGPHFGSFALGRRGAQFYTGVGLVGIWSVFWIGRYQHITAASAPDDLRHGLVQTVLMILLYYLAWSLRRTLQRQISTLKAREVELSKARDVAVLASQARSRFLATMSHEIRTPLNGIVGLPDLLRRAEDDSERAELIQVLETSGTHLLGIVNDILDFSRLESSSPVIRQEPVDLELLIESTLQSSHSQAGASQLELVALFPPGSPRVVLGDALRLEQILRNLLQAPSNLPRRDMFW